MIEAKDFLEFSNLVIQDTQNGEKANYIVDFYANWCQPCKIVARHLDSIQDQLPAKIVKINIETEEGRATAQTLGIRSIPTLVFYCSDVESEVSPVKELDRLTGSHPANAILDKANKVFG